MVVVGVTSRGRCIKPARWSPLSWRSGVNDRTPHSAGRDSIPASCSSSGTNSGVLIGRILQWSTPVKKDAGSPIRQWEMIGTVAPTTFGVMRSPLH